MPETAPLPAPTARRGRGGPSAWPGAAALVGACLLTGAAAALGLDGGVPDQASLDLVAGLAAVEAAVEGAATPDPRASLAAAAAVWAPASTASAPAFPAFPIAPIPVSGAPAEGDRVPLRLALLVLSQAHGHEGNASLIAAQADPAAEALALTSGVAGLADLRRLLRVAGLPYEGEGARLRLRTPLVVWGGASLRLGPGEALELSRPDGAFLLNLGRLEARRATVAAVGETNPRVRSFVPFLVSAEGGALDLRDAHMTGLGFGDLPKFAGVAVLGSLLRPAQGATAIEGTTFEDVLTVVVRGAPDVTLRGNLFLDPRGAALAVSRSRGVRILSNLFAGEMPTNAIRLEDGSRDGLVAGNVLLGGERAGIVARGGSAAAVIEGNVVWNRDGGGILVAASDCATVRANLVIDNAQKGIEVRGAEAALVEANTVWSNHSAGIWVSDQAEGTVTTLAANAIAFNGAGLAAAGGSLLLLRGNDFSDQFQQFLAGDLAPQTPHVARDMRGQAPLVLSADGLSDAPPDPLAAPAACPA